jgi:hypothetical protein
VSKTTWPPQPWSDSQLEADASRSLQALNDAQGDVAGRRGDYAEFFDEGLQLFDELMQRSNNLLYLTGSSFNSDRGLVAMGRFTGGPLISHDDLERIVGNGLANKKIEIKRAADAAKVIVRLIDPGRFPWVEQARSPREYELSTARVATAL